MSDHEKVYLEKLQGHNCFACGTVNPVGLNLSFYKEGERICTDITLGRNYEGWENIAHGGIISALLDEVMAWTVLWSKRTFLVTRKMDIKYIKPVMIGTALTVQGEILDDSKPPKINTGAKIIDDKRNLLVKGWAEFVMLSKERMNSVPEELKNEMLSLFNKFDQARAD